MVESSTARCSLFFALLALTSLPLSRSQCQQIDACSCRDTASGKLIDLHPLSRTDRPAFNITVGKYGISYNPCSSFSHPGNRNYTCTDVVICQTDFAANETYSYPLGTLESARFTSNATTTILSYNAEGPVLNFGNDLRRVSHIVLECDEEEEQGRLEFIQEFPALVYTFRLYSKCACPGRCSGEERPTCSAEGPKNCACRLSSDNKLINLLSLDNPEAPLVLTTSTSKIYLNPCSGVDVGSGCTDAVSCVYRAGEYTEFGHPSTANYSVDAAGRVSLSYKSLDGARRTNIRLVCDPAQRHYPRLVDVGEPTSSLLELELHSVCACPGECFNPVLTCARVDDCTCTLSEGFGTVNLHDLDNPFAPLRLFLEDTRFNASGWWYYYNPCTGFSVDGQYENCHDVAACQVGSPTPLDFSLGTQSTVTYRSSSVGELGAVTLLYTGGTTDRQVAVTALCNNSATIPTLSFDKEDPTHHYYLTLQSNEACPRGLVNSAKEASQKRQKVSRKVRPSRPIIQD